MHPAQFSARLPGRSCFARVFALFGGAQLAKKFAQSSVAGPFCVWGRPKQIYAKYLLDRIPAIRTLHQELRTRRLAHIFISIRLLKVPSNLAVASETPQLHRQ